MTDNMAVSVCGPGAGAVERLTTLRGVLWKAVDTQIGRMMRMRACLRCLGALDKEGYMAMSARFWCLLADRPRDVLPPGADATWACEFVKRIYRDDDVARTMWYTTILYNDCPPLWGLDATGYLVGRFRAMCLGHRCVEMLLDLCMLELGMPQSATTHDVLVRLSEMIRAADDPRTDDERMRGLCGPPGQGPQVTCGESVTCL